MQPSTTEPIQNRRFITLAKFNNSYWHLKYLVYKVENWLKRCKNSFWEAQNSGIKEILCLVGLQRGHFDFLPLLCQVGNCFGKKWYLNKKNLIETKKVQLGFENILWNFIKLMWNNLNWTRLFRSYRLLNLKNILYVYFCTYLDLYMSQFGGIAIGPTFIADHSQANGQITESWLDHFYHCNGLKNEIMFKVTKNSESGIQMYKDYY